MQQPPIDSGFYYEMALPDGAAVQETDWKPLENLVGKISKEKQKFERLTLTKEDLLDMFKYNKYKVGVCTENDTSLIPNLGLFSNISSRTRFPTEPRPLSTETAH